MSGRPGTLPGAWPQQRGRTAMNRMNSVETGARIAALRKERGMTQRDLAQPVGVSDKAVSKWERGVSLS